METFKINDIDYSCEFKLKNGDGQEVEFTKSALRGMRIVDDIFSPFASGEVNIANPYDYIEDDYLVRGDGRDTFTIEFYPTDKSKDKFKGEFFITDDKGDGNPNVRSENIKTYYLMETTALPFMDKVPYGKSFTGKAGKIIQDIFVDLLGEDKVDNENWEEGDFSLTYIPPASYRYIDVVYYLLRHHYIKAGDLYVKCFLIHDHEKEKYTFKPITKLYEDNKKNVMEAFSLGDVTDKIDTSNPNNPPAEAEVGEYIGNIRNIGYSTPMYSYNNNFFVNSIVHGYDPVMGEYKSRKLELEDVMEKWKTKFVEVFKSVAGKPKPFVVTNKSTGEKYKWFKFPYPVEDGIKIVEAEMYNALTFYNLQSNFANIGDVRRKVGKFVDIFKTNDKILKSDEKILGRWLVTSLHHIFAADTYSNEFFCCKTYVGPDSNIKDNVE